MGKCAGGFKGLSINLTNGVSFTVLNFLIRTISKIFIQIFRLL